MIQNFVEKLSHLNKKPSRFLRKMRVTDPDCLALPLLKVTTACIFLESALSNFPSYSRRGSTLQPRKEHPNELEAKALLLICPASDGNSVLHGRRDSAGSIDGHVSRHRYGSERGRCA